MVWSKQATNHNLQPEGMMDKSRDTWHHGKSLGHNVFMNYRYTSQNNTAVRLLNFQVYSKYLSPPPAPQPLPSNLPSNPLLLPYMQNPHMVIVPADVSPPDGARPSACTAPVANIWSVLCQSFPGLGDIESPLLTRWHNLKWLTSSRIIPRYFELWFSTAVSNSHLYAPCTVTRQSPLS